MSGPEQQELVYLRYLVNNGSARTIQGYSPEMAEKLLATPFFERVTNEVSTSGELQEGRPKALKETTISREALVLET